MKKALKVILWVIGIGIVIASIASVWYLPPDGYKHTGKVQLNDAQEYSQFKQHMASDDVNIKSLDVLNDDYPKLVNFEYVSQDGTAFYGENIKTLPNTDYFLCFFFSSIPLVIAVCIKDD